MDLNEMNGHQGENYQINPIEKYYKLSADILASEGTKLAFFKGSYKPDILVVGEAPGFNEDKQGIPFVGRSGQYIDQEFEHLELNNYNVAFLNAVFRMPLNENKSSFRKPTSDEISFYRPMINEIISFLEPKYILLLGATASESLLGKNRISSVRGKWINNILQTYHPSFVLRNPENKSKFQEDLRSLAEALTPLSQEKNKSSENNKNHTYREMTAMNDQLLIDEIKTKSEQNAKELATIQKYIDSDPQHSVVKSRKILESVLKRKVKGHDLFDMINEVEQSEIATGQLLNSMHMIRKNGNLANHTDEIIEISTAQQSYDAVKRILIWNYDINEQNLTSEIEPNETPNEEKGNNVSVRFFIADQVFKTWPKLAVLSSDGVFYSEYLAWMKLVVVKKEGIDFDSFKPEEFSFGEQEHGSGYQPIREVSYREASNFGLISQENWIDTYLSKIGFESRI